MKCLLDTHCVLWMIAEPQRLGPKARDLLNSQTTELFLSTASLFEISVKYSLKKLALPARPLDYLPTFLDQMGVRDISVTRHHAFRVSELPWHHRDPFDRLILAQAMVERLPLVTGDDQLSAYKVKIIDARK